MTFDTTRARHLRVSLTDARQGEHWTVADLQIFGEHHPAPRASGKD